MKSNVFPLLAAALLAAACSHQTSPTVLKTDVPARPAGQENVLGLRTDPIETVRIGVVGLGMRGSDAVVRLGYVPGAVVTAICDVVPRKVNASQKNLSDLGRPAAKEFTGSEDAWKALCEDEDVDVVYICTDWSHHVPIALYAMECGKHAAVEVPAAGTLEDIWALVNTAERTRQHCIMLENCCYDDFELATLAMAQAGALGEPIHAEGSYQHNLDLFWKAYEANWRLQENQRNRGDLYPTHGLGPVAQVMNIHRGDRMKTLVAMDTQPFNGGKMSEKLYGQADETFAAGDQTSTLIRTEKGKTILVEHDVMTPRPYSRMFQVVGTDGYAGKYPNEILCFREFKEGEEVNAHTVGTEKVYRGEMVKEILAKYPNPILTPELVRISKEVGGHGGMDYVMDYRWIYCLQNGLPMDIDVYDLAEWCCVTPLSRLSIENGSMPVEIPDFTRGAWDQVQGFHYAFAE